MRKNILFRLLIFIGLVSTLLIFSNCRILQKDLSRDKTEINQEVNSALNSNEFQSEKTEFNQETKSSYDLSNVRFSDFISLSYEPMFDVEGKIIPLIFRQTINGKTDEIFLSGGTFNQDKNISSEVVKQSNSNTINTKFISEISYKSHLTYKTLTNYKTKEFRKIKSVWGFDLNFWTGLTIVIQLIILGIIIYKMPKSWLKNIYKSIRKKSSDL